MNLADIKKRDAAVEPYMVAGDQSVPWRRVVLDRRELLMHIDQLQAALRGYGEHTYGCANEERHEPTVPGYPGRLKGLACDCGLHQWLDFAPQRSGKSE